MASAARSGTAALVGRPNVGKSTLLNRLLGLKVAIVSPKPQTTRHRILGVVSTPKGQIGVIDAPGIQGEPGALNKHLSDLAWQIVLEADAAVMMVEAGPGPGSAEAEDRRMLHRLSAMRKPVVLAVNKIDRIAKPLLLPMIDRYRGWFAFADVVPISAKTSDGLEVFKATVLRVLPEGHSLYDPKMLTDQTERMLVGEYVREQLLRFCRQEVPHRSAVVVDYFDEGERGTTGRELVRIGATIFVEKQSQRAIVIGKRGQMLKVIGSEARRQIERLLDAHVYLELRVAVEAGWSERVSGLVKMGYG